MFTPRDIVWSIIIPALIALAIGLACWQPWRRGPAKAWGAPLAMGLAFFFVFPAILNPGPWHWPALVPREASEWLPWIALLATLFGLFSISIATPRWVWAIIVLLTTALACGWMLKFKFAHAWTPMQGGLILLGFGLAAAIWWAILEVLSEEAPISSSILHWLLGSCSAIVLMLTGCLTYGKFTLPLAAAAGAMVVLTIWRRQKVRLNGMPMVFSIVMIATLAGGMYLSSLKLPEFLLILSSPLLAGLSILLPMRMRFWQRLAIRLVLAALPLAAAVSIAAVQFAHEQQESTFSDE